MPGRSIDHSMNESGQKTRIDGDCTLNGGEPGSLKEDKGLSER